MPRIGLTIISFGNNLARSALLVFLFSILLILTGCWDRIELENRAIILAISVDKAGPEEMTDNPVTYLDEPPSEVDNWVKLTVQIAVPGRIPLGPEVSAGEQKPVWVLSATGVSVNDAVQNLQQKTANELFLGHLRVIAVSEAYARDGLQNLNDYLRRNAQVRKAAWMIVVNGEASTLLDVNPELERVPALYLVSILESAVRMGKVPNLFLGRFWTSLSSQAKSGLLAYLQIEDKENILLKGMAFFRGDQMVGVTEPLEIGYYMAVKGINPGGYPGLAPGPEDEDELVIFRAEKRKSRIKIRFENGIPHIDINIHIEGNITEKNSETFAVDTNEKLKEITERFAQLAVPKYSAFFQKTQQYGVDIIGLGEYVRARYPNYWMENVKEEHDWEEIYKEIPIHVDVKYDIRRVGMKSR